MEYFGTDLDDHGHYRFLLEDDRIYGRTLGFSDLPFNPEQLTNNLPKGEVIFYQGGGYTVLGISGSCKDTRRETKSIFWVKEILTKEQLIEAIKNNVAAMRIINAIPFKIKW